MGAEGGQLGQHSSPSTCRARRGQRPNVRCRNWFISGAHTSDSELRNLVTCDLQDNETQHFDRERLPRLRNGTYREVCIFGDTQPELTFRRGVRDQPRGP